MLRLHESRTRDCSGQPDVSAMHLFTKVSNWTPSAILVSKSKRRLDLEWVMAYHHESYQACRGLEWRDNHPTCANSIATMHVAVALSLDETLHIYTLQRTAIDQHSRPTDTTTSPLGQAQKQTSPANRNSIMSTQIQQEVDRNNERYAASFTSGHLALPPARKYLVGTHSTTRVTFDES
jgi:hypothetical protein